MVTKHFAVNPTNHSSECGTYQGACPVSIDSFCMLAPAQMNVLTLVETLQFSCNHVYLVPFEKHFTTVLFPGCCRMQDVLHQVFGAQCNLAEKRYIKETVSVGSLYEARLSLSANECQLRLVEYFGSS